MLGTAHVCARPNKRDPPFGAAGLWKAWDLLETFQMRCRRRAFSQQVILAERAPATGLTRSLKTKFIHMLGRVPLGFPLKQPTKRTLKKHAQSSKLELSLAPARQVLAKVLLHGDLIDLAFNIAPPCR